VVAPQLYIACGISGAVQHLAGIRHPASGMRELSLRSIRTPIFSIADYGLVADPFVAVPELVVGSGICRANEFPNDSGSHKAHSAWVAWT
jgi:hypothetical protein